MSALPCHGFVRVAAASPVLRVADVGYNVEQIVLTMQRAEEQQAAVLVFPELSLSAYTCADLFQQPTLLRGVLAGLRDIVAATSRVFGGVAIVGLPLTVDDQLFNCAAIVVRGSLLGIVPKSYLPNYKEFYEARWFALAATARSREVVIDGTAVPFGTDLLFRAVDAESLTVGVEICEDLWVPIPPSSLQALAGATLLTNLSASNETIGKVQYRRQLVSSQSARCIAAYVYASCGVHESTTDLVFSGHCLIAENGSLIKESQRYQRDGQLVCVDVDLERLGTDRLRTNSYGAAQLYPGMVRAFRSIPFQLSKGENTPSAQPRKLLREIEAHPFVPREQDTLNERCQEIFQTQVAGLARRLEQIGKPSVAIGISGGLDSTLALLVVCKTFDLLNVPRQKIQALTMPGFGTTRRTLDNSHALMKQLGVSAREVDIRKLCLEEWRALGHSPFEIDLRELTVDQLTDRLLHRPAHLREDLVFENVQARMRTSLLMNTGFVIGTGDVSESALGWCTYNGDHMSNYNPNSSIPKTLVKFLVRWVALHEADEKAKAILLDIVDTIISPELLPVNAAGEAVQATEGFIGPYELHDFFLFHFLRYGAAPEKILYLAEQARFDKVYAIEDIRRFLKLFLRRFFGNQFKRSCLPDGPKVGSISLSPRGDWRMPSDAQARLWLAWADGEGK
jgi:NAD+ synthase (glutamine-hydrolysing)